METMSLRIDMSEINEMMQSIMPQLQTRGDEWARKMISDFRDMKPYGIDMCKPEFVEGAIKYVPTEEFFQHLRENGIDI